MKMYTPASAVFLTLFLWSAAARGQSWEVFFQDPALDQSYYNFVYPGPNNGVRMAISDVFSSDPATVFAFDADGNFSGQSTVGWTTDWELFNTDPTGATYWVTFYKVRKLTAGNQIAWSYTPPVSAGILWETAAPNGNTCLLYYGNSSGQQTIDWVDENGQLVNRFYFAESSPVNYYPGYDKSLIYSDIQSGTGTDHWIKLNQSGQVVWERDLSTDASFLSGSLPDGSTLYMNGYNLICLNAAGNLLWERSMLDYFPDSYYLWNMGWLVRQDGSLIIATANDDLPTQQYAPRFINIKPSTGDLIWSKKIASTLESYTMLSAPLSEMPDGGILASFGTFGQNGIYDEVLLVRTDPNGNTLTNQIAGNVFFDTNTDCTKQAGEIDLKQVSVIAQSGTKKYSGTTDHNGNFSMATTAGEYTLTISQPGSYWNYCDLPDPVTMGASQDTAWLSIGAKATVICPQMTISIGSNVFRRCFDNNYLSVYYQNAGTAPAVDAEVSVTLDPGLIFLSATSPVLSQNGNTYIFDVGTVDIGESGAISINLKVDCDAGLGDLLCVDSHVSPDASCLPSATSMASNSFCLPVVASYDPNDKTAFVDGKPETAKILPDVGVEYLIRFQNTGTDTAFNIVVSDTLTQLLDAASVVPGASSHPYFFELRDGNVLRFVFSNILLPDSTTDEPASHGFIKFFIRQTTGNLAGAALSNRAAIFFDYNDPVITNESRLVVTPSVRTKEATSAFQPRVWPVPAHDRAEIRLPEAAPAIVSWNLTDALGRVMRSGGPESSAFILQRSGLPGGLYWCRLSLQDGSTAMGRVIFD